MNNSVAIPIPNTSRPKLPAHVRRGWLPRFCKSARASPRQRQLDGAPIEIETDQGTPSPRLMGSRRARCCRVFWRWGLDRRVAAEPVRGRACSQLWLQAGAAKRRHWLGICTAPPTRAY